MSRNTRVSGRRPMSASLCAVVAILALWPAGLWAQLTPEQVLRIEQVGAVAMSPDGRLVAYTLTRPRAATDPVGGSWSELWVVPAAGGEARAVVRAPQSASSPAWSADGSQLAFTTRIEAQNPQTQVYVVPAAGGDPRAITRSPTGVMAFQFSPDGRTVAYTAVEPEAPDAAQRRAAGDDVIVASQRYRRVRLWAEPVQGGERIALTPPSAVVRDFVWAPDSRSIAVQTTAEPDVDADMMYREMFTVPATGGALTPLAETQGKLGPMAWSPDGTRIAWVGAVSFNDPLAQSVFVARPGAPAVNRTPGYEASVLTVTWLDANTIAFVAAEGTRTSLNRLNAANGPVQRVAGGGAEVFLSASIDAAARTFAVSASTSTHPGELYTGSLRDGVLRRITRHNPWLSDVRLARQETIEWTGAKGERIAGVYIHPLSAQPGVAAPLAVLPHGGPEGISYDNWTTNPLYPAQVLAGQGYGVLMPNYRGSGGRGVAFSKGDHRDLGGEEFMDVLAGIDDLAARGWIDAGRVGMSGTSYGGYFSALAGTRFSDRFRLAIPFAGISNWISFTGTTDIPVEMSAVHWDLFWFDNVGLSMDRSPIANLATARTPMLIGHGLVDERVHPEQSIQLYTSLKLKGVPTELVLYPREPHGLRERAHQLDFMNRVVEWFDRYVKPARPISN